MDTLEVPMPYKFEPRSDQCRMWEAWEDGIRQFMVIRHRRSGKTENAVAFVSTRMCDRVGTYAHIFPYQKQARESIWYGANREGQRYLDHFPEVLRYGPPNNSELALTYKNFEEPDKPGARYIMQGTDRNVNAVVAMNTLGIIWDEWALQNPMARQLARPVLVENDGWEMIATTVRGENHLKGLYDFALTSPRWHVEYLTVHDTKRDGPGEDGSPVITDEQIEQERKEAKALGIDDIDATIDQEYFLNWKAPMPGAYYGIALREMYEQGRVTGVPWEPRKPVYTAWDLGTAKSHDTNAIWFYQMHGSRVCIIDYLLASNHGVDWFVAYLKVKPYQYIKHYCQQYDLEEADWGSGKSRVETAAQLGLVFTPTPRLRHHIEYVNASRLVLQRCYFDEGKGVPLEDGNGIAGVGPGLNALGNYRREKDVATQKYRDTPVHDWSSHGATAFHVLALSIEDPFQSDEQALVARKPQRVGSGVGFDPLR